MFKLLRKIITLIIVLAIAAIVFMVTSCTHHTCTAYRGSIAQNITTSYFMER